MFENCKKNGPPARHPRGLVHQCCCSFRTKPGMFGNFKKTGPTSVVAIFERSKTARRLVPHVRKLQEDWSTSVVAVFEQTRGVRKLKTARRLVPPVLLQFSNVRKLQEEWSPHVRKLQQQWSILFEICKNTGPNVRKLQEHWFTIFENCNNNGPPCSKSARTLENCARV